jgi:NAD+ synthase (glutamine-hydrolysing)
VLKQNASHTLSLLSSLFFSFPSQVIADLDRLFPRPAGASAPTRAEIAGHLFFTCYMGTDNSSEETRERARALAADIGASHVEGTIDSVVAASVQWVTDLTGARPTFESGSRTENLALQNVQARVRMVQAYLAAQLLLAARGRAGALLVLGSANVDEGLRGFLTKYDCSSADVNPIGGISKLDLRAFLEWGARADTLDYPSLKAIAEAKATPELIPIAAGGARQVSEEDMGFSFEELGAFGRLRKLQACGPVSMYVQLRVIWSRTPAKVIADKVSPPVLFSLMAD